MQDEIANKAMGQEDVKTKSGGTDTPAKEEKVTDDYFFPGEAGKYVPQTIRATSLAEATAEYEKTKIEVNN